MNKKTSGYKNGDPSPPPGRVQQEPEYDRGNLADRILTTSPSKQVFVIFFGCNMKQATLCSYTAHFQQQLTSTGTV